LAPATGAPGPHAFAVRGLASLVLRYRPRPSLPASRVVTMRIRPSCRGGMAERTMILRNSEEEYFSQPGWTNGPTSDLRKTDLPVGQDLRPALVPRTQRAVQRCAADPGPSIDLVSIKGWVPDLRRTVEETLRRVRDTRGKLAAACAASGAREAFRVAFAFQPAETPAFARLMPRATMRCSRPG
jgi:hypothetical protein